MVDTPYELVCQYEFLWPPPRNKARKRQRRLAKQQWMQLCRKAKGHRQRLYADYNRRIVDHIHATMWKILLRQTLETPGPLERSPTYSYTDLWSIDKIGEYYGSYLARYGK